MADKSPAADLIERLGDYQKVADRLGVAHSTVAVWKSRRAIPRTQWPDLIDAFPEIDFDTLKATEQAA